MEKNGVISEEFARILVRGYEKARSIKIGENAVMAIRKKYIQHHNCSDTAYWAFYAIDGFARTQTESKQLTSEILDSVIPCGDFDIDVVSQYIRERIANTKRKKATAIVTAALEKTVTAQQFEAAGPFEEWKLPE